MVAADEGVYVAVRGKIALLKDTDGDGAADLSEAVVSGWERENYNNDTRNDAAGVAIDTDGNLYFSLGCMSYNKAWLLDADGVSHYDRSSERGTILKVSPDRSRREILATGLRFVIGMEFNRHGDLFATDQEGDTWFPGGNPRDELLHIIPGRHYGFPFRHPKHLPDIVDEPYVVGFSPQHQSSCGFRFNEPRANQKPFGPSFWEGNAVVTGFSRGKLWRTPLAKTRAGYVGKQVQIVAFESLPTDVAVTPDGDLLVTCHGGRPDWGSGPGGEGHLYRISFDAAPPQPVIAWPAGPLTTKVAFDKPLTRGDLGEFEIEMGEFAWEGDRLEWIWPGYEVVKAEKRAMRRPLAVNGVKISDDGRTATITTAPHAWRARYRLGFKLEGSSVETSYDLGGVEASWSGDDGNDWHGWLPHVDLNVARTLTRASADHENLEALLRKSGALRLNGLLLLPGRDVGLRFEASRPFDVSVGGIAATSRIERGRQVAEVSFVSTTPVAIAESRGGREMVLPTETVPLEIKIRTGDGEPLEFDASYHADFDPYERPLRLEHLFVPWAPDIRPGNADPEERDADHQLVGDSAKGRAIFFGTDGLCSTCHTYDGEGTPVAADLTVCRKRDPDAVLRDIVEPSVAINPDFVSYEIETTDGGFHFGLVRSTDEEGLVLVGAGGVETPVARSDIESIRASSNSLMPAGFAALGDERLRDLVAFLCGAGVVRNSIE